MFKKKFTNAEHYRDTKKFFDKSARDRQGFYDANNNRGLKHNRWQIIIRKKIADTINVYKSQIKNVYDLGCGNGDFTFELANKFPDLTFKGFDFSVEVVGLAQKQHNGGKNIEFLTTDLLAMNISEQADLVLCVNTLHHIHKDDLKKVLDAIAQIANKYIILEIKNKKNFYYGFLKRFKKDKNIEVYPTSVKEVSEIFKKHGFHLDKIYPLFLFKFASPLIVLCYKKNKIN